MHALLSLTKRPKRPKKATHENRKTPPLVAVHLVFCISFSVLCKICRGCPLLPSPSLPSPAVSYTFKKSLFIVLSLHYLYYVFLHRCLSFCLSLSLSLSPWTCSCLRERPNDVGSTRMLDLEKCADLLSRRQKMHGAGGGAGAGGRNNGKTKKTNSATGS